MKKSAEANPEFQQKLGVLEQAQTIPTLPDDLFTGYWLQRVLRSSFGPVSGVGVFTFRISHTSRARYMFNQTAMGFCASHMLVDTKYSV